MTNKYHVHELAKFKYSDIREYIDENHTGIPLRNDILVDLLNKLNEEKEDWKHDCLTTVSENSILWNEILVLLEQDAEPSNAFKNYLDNLKNKYKKCKVM